MGTVNRSKADSQWIAVSTEVLSTILVDPGAAIPVIEKIGVNQKWFPAAHRRVYAAIRAVVADGEYPSQITIAGRGVPTKLLRGIANEWSDAASRALLQNIDALVNLGMAAEVSKIGDELSSVSNAELHEIPEIARGAANKLSGLLSQSSGRDAGPDAVDDAAWNRVLDYDEGRVIPSGLKQFDRIAAGLHPGMIYWIAGAYKSGKTTLMRNMVLSCIDNHVPIDVFALEGSREMFVLAMQSMIATRFLIESGDAKRLILSPLLILRGWKKEGVLTEVEKNAVNVAREIWKAADVRVWDTRDGVRDTQSLMYRVRQSAMQHGTRVAFVDYLQLLDAAGGKTLFERASTSSIQLQELAVETDITVVVLAQRNESAISGAKSNTASPGIKGGGDAAATADFLLLPSSDIDIPGRLSVELKLSRWTQTDKWEHGFNAPSGLLLDKWEQRTKLEY